MLVGDRMIRQVITIQPQETLEDALRLMRADHISRLPVVDRSGKLVGIVTEKQILRYSPSNATTLDRWEIKEVMNRITMDEIMAKNVVTVSPDTPLEEVARIMIDSEIGGLPVIDKGRLVGIITETDLFKIFLEMLSARQPGVRLSVSLPDIPGQIAALTQAIFIAGGNITAMTSILGESSGTREWTIKVNGISKDALVDLVNSLVSKILDVRETVVV
jgi:acetoin utilization protein AcuB